MYWIPMIKALGRVAAYEHKLEWQGPYLLGLSDEERDTLMVKLEDAAKQILDHASNGHIRIRGRWQSGTPSEPDGDFQELTPEKCLTFAAWTPETIETRNGIKGPKTRTTDALYRPKDRGPWPYFLWAEHFRDVQIEKNSFQKALPSPISTKAAEVQCEMWLRKLFVDNADNGTRSKHSFREEALQRHERLSRRGFDRAWIAAAKDFPKRSQPGAKPK